MCLNHPETIPPSQSVKKLSSTKPGPGAKMLGTTDEPLYLFASLHSLWDLCFPTSD